MFRSSDPVRVNSLLERLTHTAPQEQEMFSQPRMVSSGGRGVAGEHGDVKFNLSHSSQSQDLIFELSMLRPVLKTLLADLLTKMSTRISVPRHLMEDKYRLSSRARRRGLRGRRKWRWDLARRSCLSVTFVIPDFEVAATSTPTTRRYTS